MVGPWAVRVVARVAWWRRGRRAPGRFRRSGHRRLRCPSSTVCAQRSRRVVVGPPTDVVLARTVATSPTNVGISATVGSPHGAGHSGSAFAFSAGPRSGSTPSPRPRRMFASKVFTSCPACCSARLRAEVLVACRPLAGPAILWAEKIKTRKHGAGEPSKRGAGGQMHARSERPSVASGVAERAAMAGGVSSVAVHGDGGGILSFFLPYSTLPYLTLTIHSATQNSQLQLYSCRHF